ncbi:MAG: response regulator [Deltaproteobacteria bacterium]|nr:response regulator [Deltaproteobacteria bacterium]
MAHRILLLGPNPSQLRGLQGALIRAEQQATYAEDVQQGGALAQQFRPSLIALVTDLNAASGREDLARLMMHPTLQASPIFILTRGVPANVAVGALRTGASELIIMPTKLQVFLARVKTCIGDAPGHVASISALDRKGPALLKRIGNYLRRMAADADLRVEGTSEPGMLSFKDGRIVKAQFGKMTGTTALQRLLTEPSNRPWNITIVGEKSIEAPSTAEVIPATPTGPIAIESSASEEQKKKGVRSSTLKTPSTTPPLPENASFDDVTNAGDDDDDCIVIDLDSLDDVGVELFDEEIYVEDLGAADLPTPSAEALAALAAEVVLLVDDDPDLLRLYQSFLSKRGYIVHTAENGRLGYELALTLRPDVIVSDIMMPETDGWGFLTLVRRDARLQDTPFLLLSCHNEYLEKLKEMEAGANDYLEKGLRGDAVVERVTAALSSQRNLRAALEPGITFGGTLQDVGLRFLIKALADKRVRGVLTVEDRFARHTLQIHDQLLLSAKCEAGLAQRSSDEALSSLLGVRNGYFEFSAEEVVDAASLKDAENLESAFDRVAGKLNQSRQDVNEHLFAENSKLICDDELMRFYLVVCPDMARPVARAICEGIAPRELLGSGNFSPILVEWVVLDMLRKQVGHFQSA